MVPHVDKGKQLKRRYLPNLNQYRYTMIIVYLLKKLSLNFLTKIWEVQIMATNTTAVATGLGILFGIYGTKETSFVELPTPTESVNTYNSQTAILDNETVATINLAAFL